MAVMGLVEMQHDRAAGQAVRHAAAVVEALHARQGAADAIGIVPVHIVAMPAEVGLDALYVAGG
ncbi:hypothetical protein D9M72_593690 [compost metagenome]